MSSTHFYINARLTNLGKLIVELSKVENVVLSRLGQLAALNKVCKCCPLEILDKIFKTNLLIMLFKEFDIILRINWLAEYDVILDCRGKKFFIQSPMGESLSMQGLRSNDTIPMS